MTTIGKEDRKRSWEEMATESNAALQKLIELRSEICDDPMIFVAVLEMYCAHVRSCTQDPAFSEQADRLKASLAVQEQMPGSEFN